MTAPCFFYSMRDFNVVNDVRTGGAHVLQYTCMCRTRRTGVHPKPRPKCYHEACGPASL